MLFLAAVVALVALCSTVNGFSVSVRARSLRPAPRVLSMVAPPPINTLAAGLAGLKALSATNTASSVMDRPVSPAVPSNPSTPPMSHKSRPESKAELGFEPVRIFGKGHPGTAGKDLKVP